MPSIGDTISPSEGEMLAGTVLGGPDDFNGVALAAGPRHHGGENGAAKGMDDSGSAVAVEVLCTGSLYAVAAALEAFGAGVV